MSMNMPERGTAAQGTPPCSDLLGACVLDLVRPVYCLACAFLLPRHALAASGDAYPFLH
jgi:hypothetical protein